MATILEYVASVASQDFQALPLNELDLVCLNELAYLPLGEELDFAHSIDFQEIGRIFQAQKEQVSLDFLITKERLALFSSILESRRFADLELCHYVNEVSSEFEKQFAAAVFHLPSIEHWQLVFRGTDDTVIGWKEDFKLTYMSEIPAQRSAVAYLADFLDKAEHPVYVTGHSKGGNLAVYAASHQPSAAQEKIKAVLMLDAPGFSPAFFKKEGYQQIRNKIVVIKPKESIVGVMLQLDVQGLVVDANQSGMSQHVVTSWLVSEQGYFIGAEQTELSKKLDKTFDQWVSDLSKAELKLLVDLFFDSLLDAGLTSLNDLSRVESLGKLLKVFSELNHIEASQRSLFQKSFKSLLAAFVEQHKPEIKLKWNLDELKKIGLKKG